MKFKYLPLAALSLLFAACDNPQVEEANNSADVPAAPVNDQATSADTTPASGTATPTTDTSTTAQ
ncbi:MAG: hypothetical protein DI620_05360 [Haemophilus parainfluenzae]|nr:MAG: hypothetical protein DI620_05360 [Haemophilus parainfluenzae]